MANSVKGAQLSTYNPNIGYFTSTTAGTNGLVVYAVESGRANGGITNPPPAGQYYDGLTHFHNIVGKAGTYIALILVQKIPLTDKQGSPTVDMYCFSCDSCLDSCSFSMHNVWVLDSRSSSSCSCSKCCGICWFFGKWWFIGNSSYYYWWRARGYIFLVNSYTSYSNRWWSTNQF